MKYKLPLLAAATATFASTSHAAITLISHYGLGEAGTVSASSPFTPLVDDIADGNVNNLENGTSLSATVSSSGVTAPGSTAYLTKTQAGGWYDNSGANNFGLTNTAKDWAIQIWIRPGTNGGTLAFQTDSQGPATGESIWFQNTTNVAFSNGGTGLTNAVVGGTYTTGTWYRFGIVNYNGAMNYFINGTQVATAARAGTLSAIQIGWAGGNNPTSGAFDELNVWSFDSSVDSLANVSATMTAVPEPSTYGLMGTGALAAVAFAHRRRKPAA